ncbi:AMP-binding protein [Streptomyces yunnanensis]|uniref:AMP-binding protein n=1 Tax=Streptomyces yunnanensis TaxID=156453 RepID=A0ABY8A577_9ACTN|nr:AMP-binding protein [Streptomyces yunnanensis]WEB38712.1 AMP-binding protein [Streptomyces yunnanensis]
MTWAHHTPQGPPQSAAPATVAQLAAHAAHLHGDREALSDGEVRWTFAELAGRITAAARAALAHGVRHGDRIAVWAPNGRQWITAVLGAVSVGAVLVPLNTRYKAAEAADILFTSGTTGRPKGVLATHGQTMRVFDAWARLVTLRAGDRYLLVNPFFHTFGYKAGILACLLRGATMLPEPVYDADRALRRTAEERISVLMGPPTVFHGLLHHPERARHRLDSLRLAGTGAATVPAELVVRIRDELGIPDVFTAYGLTESAGVVTICPTDADAETLAHTVGLPLPGTELRIVDPANRPLPPGEPGEVVVRGHHVMRGYLDDPAATAAAVDPDGWLHTGDVGVLDDRGFLTLTDRIKDMYVVGGFNAYPAEVERVLRGHPAIADVAVVGAPDERLGEVGVAFVVPAEGAAPDPGELTRWARARLANFKVPRRYHLVPELPRNAGGKVVKGELRRTARSEERNGG